MTYGDCGCAPDGCKELCDEKRANGSVSFVTAARRATGGFWRYHLAGLARSAGVTGYHPLSGRAPIVRQFEGCDGGLHRVRWGIGDVRSVRRRSEPAGSPTTPVFASATRRVGSSRAQAPARSESHRGDHLRCSGRRCPAIGLGLALLLVNVLGHNESDDKSEIRQQIQGYARDLREGDFASAAKRVFRGPR